MYFLYFVIACRKNVQEDDDDNARLSRNAAPAFVASIMNLYICLYIYDLYSDPLSRKASKNFRTKVTGRCLLYRNRSMVKGSFSWLWCIKNFILRITMVWIIYLDRVHRSTSPSACWVRKIPSINHITDWSVPLQKIPLSSTHLSHAI